VRPGGPAKGQSFPWVGPSECWEAHMDDTDQAVGVKKGEWGGK